MRIVFLLFLVLTIPFKLVSQSNSNRQNKDSVTVELDSVIVFGRAAQSVPSHLRQGINPNLIDALDHIQGIFKIHDTAYPLVYRGMHSNRVRIERNGVLRTGVVDQGYLVDDVNPENLQSIKVVKGIERILFGSGAIGGVIRIDELDATSDSPNSAYSSYSSNNRAKVFGLTLAKKSERFGIRFSGRRNDAENFRFPNDEISLNSAYHQNNLSFSTALNNADKTFNAVWNHQFSNGLLERPQGFQNNPFDLRSFKNRFTYQSDFRTRIELKNKAVFEQRLWGLFLKTDQIRNSFDANFQSLNSQEIRLYDKQSAGYRANIQFSSNQYWNIKVGADLTGSWLEEQISIQDFLNPVFSNETLSNRIEKMAGAFAMVRYRQGNITLSAAMRGDIAAIGDKEQSLDFQALSGGLELEWLGSRHLKNTISLSRQFRYPSQQESVGILFGGRGIFRGNPEIKPEFSHQIEWNLVGYSGRWEYNLESWLAIFDNRITEAPLGGGEFTYENIARARTFGFEGRLSYLWPEPFGQDEMRISFSNSFIQGDNLGEEGLFSKGEPLIGIPSMRLRWGIDYKKKVSDKLSANSYFSLDRVSALQRLPNGPIRQTFGTIETASYWLASIKIEASWNSISKGLSLGLSVTNLTNSNYFPFGARIRGMGRNLNSYLRFSF